MNISLRVTVLLTLTALGINFYFICMGEDNIELLISVFALFLNFISPLFGRYLEKDFQTIQHVTVSVVTLIFTARVAENERIASLVCYALAVITGHFIS